MVSFHGAAVLRTGVRGPGGITAQLWVELLCGGRSGPLTRGAGIGPRPGPGETTSTVAGSPPSPTCSPIIACSLPIPAASSSGTSTTAKPPRCSLVSTYGPSVKMGLPPTGSTLHTAVDGATVQGWKQALGALAVHYPDRIGPYIT